MLFSIYSMESRTSYKVVSLHIIRPLFLNPDMSGIYIPTNKHQLSFQKFQCLPYIESSQCLHGGNKALHQSTKEVLYFLTAFVLPLTV